MRMKVKQPKRSAAKKAAPLPQRDTRAGVCDAIPEMTPVSDTKMKVPQKATGELLLSAGAVGIIGIAFLWAYWPTLRQLVDAWDRIPDYSHGYLVVPLAVIFLWVRRRQFPGKAAGVGVGGIGFDAP